MRLTRPWKCFTKNPQLMSNNGSTGRKNYRGTLAFL